MPGEKKQKMPVSRARAMMTKNKRPPPAPSYSKTEGPPKTKNLRRVDVIDVDGNNNASGHVPHRSQNTKRKEVILRSGTPLLSNIRQRSEVILESGSVKVVATTTETSPEPPIEERSPDEILGDRYLQAFNQRNAFISPEDAEKKKQLEAEMAIMTAGLKRASDKTTSKRVQGNDKPKHDESTRLYNLGYTESNKKPWKKWPILGASVTKKRRGGRGRHRGGRSRQGDQYYADRNGGSGNGNWQNNPEAPRKLSHQKQEKEKKDGKADGPRINEVGGRRRFEYNPKSGDPRIWRELQEYNKDKAPPHAVGTRENYVWGRGPTPEQARRARFLIESRQNIRAIPPTNPSLQELARRNGTATLLMSDEISAAALVRASETPISPPRAVASRENARRTRPVFKSRQNDRPDLPTNADLEVLARHNGTATLLMSDEITPSSRGV